MTHPKQETLDKIREHIAQGVPITVIARNLGVHRGTIYRWLAKNPPAGGDTNV